MRVFYDRLTNDKDRSLVSEHISELLQQSFQDQAEVWHIQGVNECAFIMFSQLMYMHMYTKFTKLHIKTHCICLYDAL